MDSAIDLKLVRELHFKWLSDEAGGLRTDLAGANLAGAVYNLRYLLPMTLRLEI